MIERLPGVGARRLMVPLTLMAEPPESSETLPLIVTLPMKVCVPLVVMLLLSAMVVAVRLRLPEPPVVLIGPVTEIQLVESTP